MRIFKKGIDVKWLAVFFIGIVLGIGVAIAGISIGDPDSTFRFIHGDCSNCTNLSAAQVTGNFSQRINFSNTIYATGLTATVPNDAAICRDPTTNEITVNTGITDCSASSEIFKENIKPLSEARSDKLDSINPVTYTYKNDPQRKEKIGLIAEDVAPIFPECIGYGDKGEIRGINYNCITPILILKIKDQQNTVITQQNDINNLKYRLELLEGSKTAIAPTPIQTIVVEEPAFWEFWK